MSAHQPFPTPEGPVEAAGRAGHEARETPTMNELLAACAAASAVSTPPDAAEETRQGGTAGPGAPEEQQEQDAHKEQEEPEGKAGAGTRPASTGGRDAA